MAPVTPALPIKVGRLLPVQSHHGLQSVLLSKTYDFEVGLKAVQYPPVPSSCLCARTFGYGSAVVSTWPLTADADFAGQ